MSKDIPLSEILEQDDCMDSGETFKSEYSGY